MANLSDIDRQLEVFHALYPLAVRTDERVQEPLVHQFAVDPVKSFPWSRKYDFREPVVTPGKDGEPVRVTGLRYIDFKDCTNVYFVDGKGHAASIFDLDDGQRTDVAKHVKDILRKNKIRKTYDEFDNITMRGMKHKK